MSFLLDNVRYCPKADKLLRCRDCPLSAVTESVVSKQFVHRRPTAVKRYVLPKLAAMNFVLDGVLDGGVTQSLNLDSHGKTLSFRSLELCIAVPDELAKFAR